jgi:ribosomal protein S18 acetylase RimI-like enzyme
MLEIRAALPDDFDRLWPIIEPTIRAGETYPYAPDTDHETAFALWMEQPSATYIALQDGIAVGTYYLKPNQPTLGAHVCNAGYMVQTLARGRGIGRALCEHSIAEARSHGYKAMQFNLVASSNTGAIKLYRDLGFQIVGRLPKAFDHVRLGLIDALVMYRWLEPE